MPICSSIYRPGPSSPVSLLPAGFISIVPGGFPAVFVRSSSLAGVVFIRFPVSVFSLIPFVSRRCSPLWCRLPPFSMFPVRSPHSFRSSSFVRRLPWGCALSLTDLFPSCLPSRYSVAVGRGGGVRSVWWVLVPWRGVVGVAGSSCRFAWRFVFSLRRRGGGEF